MSGAASGKPGAGRLARHGPGWSAAALLAGVVLYWLYRAVFSGDPEPLGSRDLVHYYYPTYLHLARSLRAGLPAIWNPLQLCGVPTAATLQAGSFYPPHLLFAALPTGIALASITAGHLALVAFGSFLLLRRLGRGVLAGCAAGFLATAHGVYPGMTWFPNMLEAAAWFPLGCCFCVDLASGRAKRGLPGLGAAFGLSLLAGYPQVSLYNAYGWAGTLLVVLLACRVPLRRAWGALATFGAALLLGAALAAVQLAPALELLREGPRALHGISPLRMFPFGGPDGLVELLRAPWLPMVVLPYGASATALALLPLALASRRPGVSWGLFAIGAFFVALGLGPRVPFFSALVSLPGLEWFRLPMRGLYVTYAALALLVGVALDELARDEPAPPARRRVALLAALGLAAGLALGAGDARTWTALGTACVALLATLLRRPSRRAARWGAGLLCLALAAELLTAPSWGWAVPYLHARALPYPREAPVALQTLPTSDRVVALDGPMSPRLPQKLGSVAGFRVAGDYEPMTSQRQADYFDYLRRGTSEPRPHRAPFFGHVGSASGPTLESLLRRAGLLNAAAVRWALVPREAQPELDPVLRRAGWQPRGLERVGAASFAVYENPHAAPRASVVYRGVPAPPTPQRLRTLASPGFDPLGRVFLESLDEPAGDAGLRGHAAAIVEEGDTHLTVEATLEQPGFLVLAEAFYPGWTARVDGAPAEILPANHLFRAVRLGAGRHRVEFRYQPASLYAGAGLSAAALAVWAALLLAARRGRGPRPQPATPHQPSSRRNASTQRTTESGYSSSPK